MAKEEEEEEEEDDDDDDGGDAPPRLAWNSQKAAPLVVRVIDDRENMRARKKGPPSRPPRSYTRNLVKETRRARAPRERQTGCSGIIAAVFRNVRYCQER